MTPKMSVYTYLYGMHSYNANPLAPLECKAEMYEMPSMRETWAPHTVPGFYIGNSWDHYRNHKVWVKDTKSARAGKTVFFKHKYSTQPTVTTSGALIKAADDLSKTVKGFIPQKGATMEALEQLVNIFKQQAKNKEDSAQDIGCIRRIHYLRGCRWRKNKRSIGLQCNLPTPHQNNQPSTI